jgi:hypothetical protein
MKEKYMAGFDNWVNDVEEEGEEENEGEEMLQKTVIKIYRKLSPAREQPVWLFENRKP